MAFSIANALQNNLPNPIAIDQLKRKNALAEQDQQIQQQNALTYQNQGAMQSENMRRNWLAQDTQTQQTQQADSAKWAYGAAQQLAAAKDPAQFAALADQFAQDPRARVLNIDRSHITPEAVQQIVGQAGVAAGVAPQKPFDQTPEGQQAAAQHGYRLDEIKATGTQSRLTEQTKASEKAKSAASGALTDEAKSLAVERLLAGEKPSSVLGNLGRGAQGAADLRSVQNLLAQTAKTRNISGAQVVKIMQSTAADGRAVLELGAREGKIAARVQEAQNFAIVAKDASAAVPRGQFLPYNKLQQATETQLSDPKLAKLKAATNSLINAYAAAVGGGVPTVHDKEAAADMLSTAQSPEAYNAVVDQLILETEKALEAPGQVRERMTGVPAQDGADVGHTNADPLGIR